MENKKNVLVVDDDSTAHFLVEKVFGSLKLINNIYKAFNGREALQVIEKYCNGVISIPHLILLDLHMPIMNGIEFIEALRDIECLKGRKIAIAVVSSSDCPRELERIHQLGIEHVLQKPISAEQFSRLWRSVFGTVL